MSRANRENQTVSVALGDLSPRGSRQQWRRSSVTALGEGRGFAVGTADGTVQALDSAGDERWRAPGEEMAVALAEFGGCELAVGTRGDRGRIRLLDADGSEQWAYDTADDLGVPRRTPCSGIRSWSMSSRGGTDYTPQPGGTSATATRASGRVQCTRSTGVGISAGGTRPTPRQSHSRSAIIASRSPTTAAAATTTTDSSCWTPNPARPSRTGTPAPRASAGWGTHRSRATCSPRRVTAITGGTCSTPRAAKSGRLTSASSANSARRHCTPIRTTRSSRTTPRCSSRATPSPRRAERPRGATRTNTPIAAISRDGEKLWSASVGGFVDEVATWGDRIAVPCTQHFRDRDAEAHGLWVFDAREGLVREIESEGIVTAAALASDRVAFVEEPVEYHDEGEVRGAYRLRVESVERN